MALWQYPFIVVPKKNVLKQSFSSKLNEKFYNETNFWDSGYESNCFEALNKILPKGKSWSKDIILFGKEDSNVLEIVLEDKKVIEVILRIDFRTNYIHLLNEILKICLSNEFILLDENLNIMSFDPSEIISIIENSPQYNKFEEMYRSVKSNNI